MPSSTFEFRFVNMVHCFGCLLKVVQINCLIYRKIHRLHPVDWVRCVFEYCNRVRGAGCQFRERARFVVFESSSRSSHQFVSGTVAEILLAGTGETRMGPKLVNQFTVVRTIPRLAEVILVVDVIAFQKRQN